MSSNEHQLEVMLQEMKEINRNMVWLNEAIRVLAMAVKENTSRHLEEIRSAPRREVDECLKRTRKQQE